ncbi:MAG: hypothetical protein H6Q42_563, partial [Deltaproteobacteria bacterium]|nr:hypothetical protein [Deltaproteobacteria bacterium]
WFLKKSTCGGKAFYETIRWGDNFLQKHAEFQ